MKGILLAIVSWGVALFVWCVPGGVFAQGELEIPDLPEDLTELSIDDLKGIKLSQVTSVSRKEENLFKAAAAVYVVTQEDIRRSGVTTIPEALRMVPGLHVAQIDGNKWAITARGFNSRFANKLLVLIDGRSVYTSVFSGVFWDVQDTMLEDIERIEVIRGPGGTLWGANAVNGIINIITKNAKDTQGGLVSAGTGTVENGFASVRYGGKLGDKANYRVFGKYFQRDDFEEHASERAVDSWDSARGGFRFDWAPSDKNSFVVTGNYYDGDSGGRAKDQLVSILQPQTRSSDNEEEVSGANLLARWSRQISADSDMKLQFFYDRESRDFLAQGFGFDIDTFDLDFQHRFRVGNRHEIVWGFGQRYFYSSFDESFNIQVNPANRWDFRADGFVQDEITLIDNALTLTVGSKFEENSFTGFEFQPSARMLWTPHEKHTLWAAVSRAVRTPSRITDSFTVKGPGAPLPLPLPNVVSIVGGRFDSEDLLSFEAGYKMKPSKNFLIDLAAFYNIYSDLITFERSTLILATNPAPPHLNIPFFTENRGSAETYGFEAAAKWEVTSWWQLNAGFTWLEMMMTPEAASQDATFDEVEGNDPEIQFNARSYLNLPYNLEFDTLLYYVDELDSLEVDPYLRIDLRLGWQPRANWDVSLGVLNVQESEHNEFRPTTNIALNAPTKVPRSVYGKVTYRF